MNRAKIAARTINKRPELGPQLPLQQPHVILIDPSSACNLRCRFCPTGDPELIKQTGRFQGQLALPIYEKLIRDINSFKKPLKLLHLYKEGEPLLNKNLPDFIRLAKEANIERVDTTTNGLLLTRKVSESLIQSGIDQINISLNGLNPKHYLDYTQRKVNVDQLIDEIVYLCKISGRTVVYIKCIKEHLSTAEQSLFFEIFADYADRIFFEGLQPNWPNFSFSYIKPDYSNGHYGQPLEEREVCPFIFYMMVVNSDGSVSACVQDWNHNLIVGDAKTDSLLDIWNSQAFNSIRHAHLNHNRIRYDNCRFCPVLKHGCLDNIDRYANNLKIHYE